MAWICKNNVSKRRISNFRIAAAIFQGNLMRMNVAEVQIKSARGRKAGTIGGEGET